MRRAELALIAALCACAARADIDGPESLTLYGRIYVLAETVQADAARGRMQRVSNQASMLGARGTEHLGGG